MYLDLKRNVATKVFLRLLGKSCDWRKSMLWLISNQSQCLSHCNCTQIPFLVKDWRDISHNTFPWKGLTVDLLKNQNKAWGGHVVLLELLIYVFYWSVVSGSEILAFKVGRKSEFHYWLLCDLTEKNYSLKITKFLYNYMPFGSPVVGRFVFG